ncbi:unnamed protein product [Rotaria magnacalcarata]|uniref:Iron transporter n=1 Tax=Rotaria magnacalcarata TaxID=392030 RepID=A0A816QRI1_9BILA|nr:unnamed protein product [Rotaria magnacalcarata]CAF4007991.1 unnamed protein product [Rotaria magnacalcarata]
MPTIPHVEKHFTAGETVRDAVIGMSDGLTVPFALAAGLTGAVAQSNIIVTAGLAEVAAGAIAMGLGGYLASRGDSDHYKSEYAREEDEIIHRTADEVAEVVEIFKDYGIPEKDSMVIVNSLKQRPKDWADFMMRFELGLEEPAPDRAWKSALTIALAYIIGGLVPLSSYIMLSDIQQALRWSIAVTLVALAVFGGLKARFTGMPIFRGMLQTTIVGGLAAAAAFFIARALS